MRSFLASLPFAALTFLCWGVYGPLLHTGGTGMGKSRLASFICVGLAYFVIAVIVPILLLQLRGEKGYWSISGTVWSLFAGSCGAIGALGIIMALGLGGKPLYVMPLVFGCAPVVNTIVSMWMTNTFKDARLMFFVGIVMVAAGAAGVMFFKPAHKPHAPEKAVATTAGEEHPEHDPPAKTVSAEMRTTAADLTINEFIPVLLSIGLTALCWGTYGSVLHKGQHLLGDSRLRALLCVGLAYLLIAVIVPFGLLKTVWPAPIAWEWWGAGFALAAGAAGAFGALGMILAFNFGGKPIFVMPMVFGCAPVVNTFVEMTAQKSFSQISIWFALSLLLVISGAATVLIFSPKPKKKPGGPAPAPAESRKPAPADSHVATSRDSKSFDDDDEESTADAASPVEKS
ncbi:hypothetical protein [Lignipirellula cremea]|uniref:EamA-like transporter family protein n=1 Tax=Lignipirellula cremea TaxID=2528010 RepID=A0A518DVW2_9BACT|nr:hypothetical protein [Lignipirellula cremea]QDU95976.1 hypothetical protein Pla8534_37950 [Lignipirellula cremea]